METTGWLKGDGFSPTDLNAISMTMWWQTICPKGLTLWFCISKWKAKYISINQTHAYCEVSFHSFKRIQGKQTELVSAQCVLMFTHMYNMLIHFFVIEDGPRSKRSRLDADNDDGGDGDYHRSDPQIAICLDCLRNNSLVEENIVRVSCGGELYL